MSKHYFYRGAILLIIACFFLSGCAAIQMMAGKRSPQYDITKDLANEDNGYQQRITQGKTDGKGLTGVIICPSDITPSVNDQCVVDRIAYLDYQQKNIIYYSKAH